MTLSASISRFAQSQTVAEPDRSVGRAMISVRRSAERSRIADLRQEGAVKIRSPRTITADSLEAILINSSGGLLSGDELHFSAAAERGASLVVTSQACERVYRSTGAPARYGIDLRIEDGAALYWLPQETILYNEAAFDRRIRADMAPGARLVCLEAFLWGRLEMGERVETCSLRDRWSVYCGGAPIHAENLRVEGAAQSLLDQSGVASGARASASLLVVAPDAELMAEACRAACADVEDVLSGVAVWPGPSGKLLIRLLAADGYALRKALEKLVKIAGPRGGPPRIWGT